MGSDAINARLRSWLIGLFVRAISGVSTDEDRADVLGWLAQSRDVLSGNGSFREKFTELHALIDTRRTIQCVARGVAEGVRNYGKADLPLAVKIAVPVTLLAAPFVGGQGVGIAALGGAVGLPALLLIFLGSAGITAILDAFIDHKDAREGIGAVLALIARDEAVRRVSGALKQAMQEEASVPERAPMPADEQALRQRLVGMNPYDFERHVMSFFETDGIEASWVTKKSNDMGVDGFAKKRNGGLIVVQCKRYAADNPVGRPAVQQFKGVVEEHGAEAGFVVTTSRFTDEARDSAGRSDRISLLDMDDLVRWHREPPAF